MSTWVTPAGSIGTYTQQRSLSFTFSATPSLGGRIVFEWVERPPELANLQLTTRSLLPGVYEGVLTGDTQYVSTLTTYEFIISASEITDLGGTPNPRTFSLSVNNTQWVTPAGSQGVFTEGIPLSIQFEATPSIPSNTIRYQLLNGSFPPGNTNQPLTLNPVNGALSGTPAQVNENTVSSFTLRALEYTNSSLTTLASFRDRTFQITISGTTTPQFITPGPTLFTIQDSTWQPFQLQYSNPDPNTTAVITVSAGALPPGLEINTTGLIRGYAQPPAGVSQRTYTFTLRIASESGESYATYSITVINQEFLPGFNGRNPTILNNQPLTFVIPPDDEYKEYYFNGESMGVFKQDNKLLFKFIGYDFDGDSLTYELNGASEIFSETPGTSIVYFDTNTGWLNGNIPLSPENKYQVYNFTVRAFKTINENKKSDSFRYTITIVGDIDTQIVWVTSQNLGTIYNGAISTLDVRAKNPDDLLLNYRVVGTEFTYDLRSIIDSDSTYYAFGLTGGQVISTDGVVWNTTPGSTITSGIYNIQGSLSYTDVSTNILAVGSDSSRFATVLESGDGLTWTRQAIELDYELTSIAYNGSRFVTVGRRAGLAWADNTSSWNIITLPSTLGTPDINKVKYGGGKFVAVANGGLILSSIDGINWTLSTTFEPNLRGLAYTGSRWIAVGDVGTVLVSNDAVSWVKITTAPGFNYNDAIWYTSGSEAEGSLVLCGQNGAIVVGNSTLTAWSTPNSNTTNDLYAINYINGKYYAVGNVGTIISSSDAVTWVSPTLGALPPNLSLNNLGNIVGRVAFQIDSPLTQPPVLQYNFAVQAYSVRYPEINSTRTFNLQVSQRFPLPYDNLYIKALTDQSDRDKIAEMLALVPEQYIYRPEDVYFGKSNAVIYQHMFGVPSVATQLIVEKYITGINGSNYATKFNHYWRNITLGPIKTAVARDSNFNIIYEVVYSEVIDNLVNNQGVSISKQITWPRPINLNLGPWFTATTQIYDSQVYYDQQPFIGRVRSDSVSTTTVYLDSVVGITVGQTATGVAGVVLNTDANGVPPRVVTVRPASDPSLPNTVELSVVQTLNINNQVAFSFSAVTSLTTGTAQTLYPNSLPNMRAQVQDAIGLINDPSILPLWMSTQQRDGNSLGYTPAWVIAYIKPGSVTVETTVTRTIASTDQLQLQTVEKMVVGGTIRFSGNTIGGPEIVAGVTYYLTEISPLTNRVRISRTPYGATVQLTDSDPGVTMNALYRVSSYAELIAQKINALWPYKLNQIDFELDRFEIDRSKTYNYLGQSAGLPIWGTLPSATPNVTDNSRDVYVYFPQKTILPTNSQE